MFLRTTTAALAITLGLSGFALAEIVEGTVSAVTADGQLQIILPEGARVSQGDSVQVLAEIPGVGPVAFTSKWTVTRASAGTVTASPDGTPSGTPQVGYLVRIDSDTEDATATPEPAPLPDDPMAGRNLVEGPVVAPSGVAPSDEALGFYLAAQEAMQAPSPSNLVYAAELFRQAADMGHAPAMTELGALYSFGNGVIRDDTIAHDWQLRAAEQGNADALFRLGLIHGAGRGVPADDRAAGDWMKKAALQGHARAMFVLAMLHEDGVGVSESMVEMVRWLEAAASQGHLDSMFFLGHIYLDGEDGVIPADSRKAEQFWLTAAGAGHGGAMQALGAFYTGKSDQDARKWADAAQAASIPESYMQNVLCVSERECYIPERSSAQTDPALKPATDAADTAQAQRTVRVTYVVQDCDRLAATPRDPDRPDLDMSVEYSDLEGQKVISECLEDIAEWPDTRRFYAQLARGYHKSGNHNEAFKAAMTGARLGSAQAMGFVGALYKSGGPVPRDANEALRWFEKSGHAGSITGMHFAAGMYLNGDGVPYNPQAAADWFMAAADKGSPPAYANLGILYDTGKGLPYDPDEAAANLLIGLATGSLLANEQLLQHPEKLTKQTRIVVQQILNRDGLYHGAYDGDFGPQTKRALRARIMN